MKKLIALLLALVMVASLFAGCSKNETEETTAAPVESDATEATDSTEAPTGADTLVYATSEFGQKFSPFFATTAYDMEVVDLTTGGLLAADRGGNIIRNGIEGETVEFNGTEYTYYGMGNVEVVENADGTVDYNLEMRNDIVFSDGTPATIDDVIFGIYVLADPTYDGSSTLYAVPIEGIDEYHGSMAKKCELIAAAGPDAVADGVSEEETATYWAAFNAAGEIFAQEIVDYCLANYADYGAENVATSAELWGFAGLAEDATAADFFAMIAEAYGYSVADMEAETAGSSLAELIDEQLGDAAASMNAAVELADVPNIAGIIKTGDYTMTVHCTEYDATAIYNMSFYVAPLSYYGDPAQYDYENNSFGFPKGDLSIVKEKTTAPMGCGPYKFVSYENGAVTLEANENYFRGEPKIKNIVMKESNDADYIPGIISGDFDLAVPSINDEAIMALQEANGGELSGDVLETVLVDYRGYGYLGINANLVKVGDDSGSEESKALRKAIMTVLSVYRTSVINSYYGDRASVIQYPISNTSWAAPRPTDEGYQDCYSIDVTGNPIYTADMNDQQKIDAAVYAAKEYLIAAGYQWDEDTEKFVSAPEGASMEYEILIPGQGTQDHPAYGIAVGASDSLAKLGIKLTVNDVGTSVWNDALEGNTAQLWCAAWQSTADPDMYQIYHSSNANDEGTNSNHYQITDAELDAMIVEARTSADNAFRKSTYKSCMEVILDWAVELPLYQRKDCTVASAQRVNVDTMPKDMTPYWGWYAEIENLEMN